MIKHLLIITVVSVTMLLTVGSALAAPVSLTGGDTTIAGLIAMPDNQRAELTKDQMMMMTKDQMTLLTERMIIKKLIKTVMDKDQVIKMMDSMIVNNTAMPLSSEQTEMLASGQTMEDKKQMLVLLDRLMMTLTKDQMMMMVDKMMMTMSKDQMMVMLDKMMMNEDR